MGHDPTNAQFLAYLARTGVISESDAGLLCPPDPTTLDDAALEAAAAMLVREGKLTQYQAQVLREGASQPLIFADYVVLDRIGRGGVGHVYKGIHPRMKRFVAIKVLPHRVGDSHESLIRFRREVEVSASLLHPHIVAAYDAGEDDSGRPFLVMEYVDGPDLATLVRRRGRLPVEQAVDFVIQAARGLEYAHSRGVLHRDVKPGNLLVTSAGQIKVLDLGLARYAEATPLDRDGSVGEITHVGEIMGTPDYIAPEQAVDARHADHRSDVYGLGATFYFLLTGRPVFQADTMMKKILAHRDQPVPSVRSLLPGVPPQIDGIVARMLAKSPENRLQAMRDVIDLLEAVHLDSPGSRTTLVGQSQDTANAEIEAPDLIVPDEEPPASTQLKSLEAYIGTCVAVTGFVSIDEEQDIFRRGAEMDLTRPQIEAILNLGCRMAGWSRETILNGKLETLLAQTVELAGCVSQKSFEYAVGFAVRRHMPRAHANEVCATAMLNHNWRAKESLLDRWFTRRLRQYGLR